MLGTNVPTATLPELVVCQHYLQFLPSTSFLHSHGKTDRRYILLLTEKIWPSPIPTHPAQVAKLQARLLNRPRLKFGEH